MACSVTISDGTICSVWTRVVGALHRVVAHTTTVLLTALIGVEALMNFMVDPIVNAATLRVGYTWVTTIEKPRSAETALFASHFSRTWTFQTVGDVTGAKLVFTIRWTREI